MGRAERRRLELAAGTGGVTQGRGGHADGVGEGEVGAGGGAVAVIVWEEAIVDGDDLVQEGDDGEHEDGVVRMGAVGAVERRGAEGDYVSVLGEGFVERAGGGAARRPAIGQFSEDILPAEARLGGWRGVGVGGSVGADCVESRGRGFIMLAGENRVSVACTSAVLCVYLGQNHRWVIGFARF